MTTVLGLLDSEDEWQYDPLENLELFTEQCSESSAHLL
jgi:hypothetical protein